ncbi:MAG TPA: hypothetical protein VEQ63_10780 [Bryobacteraceae bacterium]|nr:hypothetical protein [Bryobacteraceae bacterium]
MLIRLVLALFGFLAGVSHSAELQWLPDGTRIAIGKKWVLDTTVGRYIPLVCPAPGCAESVLSLAPAGSTGLLLHESRLAIGVLPGPIQTWTDIPQWIASSADALVNVAFWLTQSTAYVHQFDRRANKNSTCRTYDSRSGKWLRAPGGCLVPEFSFLAQVDRGPARLVALHSSAAGAFALQIVRYSAVKGQSPTRVKSIVIDGASSVHVRFAPDGSQVDLLTPCRLETGSTVDCSADFESAKWRQYSVAVATGVLRLRRANLPADAALHPRADTFAWFADNSICVGDPNESKPRCFPLPD